MNKFQLKKQSMESANKFQRAKLTRKGADETIKPDIFEKGLKPIVQQSIKMQFNEQSNDTLYGLIQLLIEKQVITNDEYLTYCVKGIQIAKQTNKRKGN